MSLINWTDDLSVGIKSIDTEHRRLVGMINSLHDARTKGKGHEVLDPMLDGLVGSTQSYFKHEEELLTKYGYPGSAAHKLEHDTLVKDVAALHARVRAGQAEPNAELFDFLKEWLTAHLHQSDRAYASFLKEKGVV